MKHPIYLIILVLFFSCKNNSETKPETPAKILKTPSVEAVENPTGINSHLPRLFSNGEQLYMSWVTRKETTDYLNYSVFDGTNWAKAETVTQGNDWFINWADFPVISENNGTILTTYLQKSDTATYAYDIKFNIYSAKTKSWKKNLKLHSDNTKTEHGFVSVAPRGDGFEVAWLDGRNSGGGHESHEGHGAGGAMSLRSAFITSDGNIVNDVLLDGRVCDCCQTSMAASVNGAIVAYRDRSEHEIRDISIVSKAVPGHLDNNIQTVYNDNWKIAGCPVNGPSIDAFDTSMGVAWFTAADSEGKVKASFLGSESIEPIRVDNGNATGRVDIAMISKTEALVLWMEPKGSNEVIILAKITAEGKKVSEVIISETSPERASGFPQLEVLENTAYIAWTDVDGKNKSIKTATIALKSLK